MCKMGSFRGDPYNRDHAADIFKCNKALVSWRGRGLGGGSDANSIVGGAGGNGLSGGGGGGVSDERDGVDPLAGVGDSYGTFAGVGGDG